MSDLPTTTSSAPGAAPARAAGRPGAPLVRLARHGALYTLSTVAVKVAGLLLLPLFTNPAYLAQADYGRFQLLEVTAQILIFVGGLGLAQGLLKFVHDPDWTDEQRGLRTTAWIATGGLAALLAALTWFAAPVLAGLLVDDPTAVLPVRIMGLYVALKVVGAIPLTLLRADERAGRYAIASAIEAALYVVATGYLMGGQRLGLVGAMSGYAVASGGALVALAVLSVGSGTMRQGEGSWFRWPLLRPLLRFGLPLALGALASVALNAGDRYVLKALAPGGATAAAEAVALYGLAAKYGGLINMLFVQSFNLAFAVVGLKALAGPEGADVHRRTFRHYVAWTGWGVLGVSVLTRDVTALVSPDPAYLAADGLVLPIALGFMAYGVYFIGMNVLYAGGRSRAIAAGVIAAGVANVLLNLLVVPRYGAMGSALATLVTYAGLAGVTMWRAHKSAPARYAWDALAVVLLLVLGLWAVAQPSLGWDTALRLPLRLALVLVYPPLLVLCGVYRMEELRGFAAAARARLQRRPTAADPALTDADLPEAGVPGTGV
ncbi:MAG TPA: polysaccharide biosynthesis C-terminal domain-containing protein [Rhodothermales bacterium]|nr:polysaccharide biosynthesis C-terminal domain-containing protein [Rhodothermales bacterium]